jgi:hypothetical protein
MYKGSEVWETSFPVRVARDGRKGWFAKARLYNKNYTLPLAFLFQIPPLRGGVYLS